MKSLRSKMGPWLRGTSAASVDGAGANGAGAAEDGGDEGSAEVSFRERKSSDVGLEGSDSEEEESLDARMVEPERLQTLTQLIRQFSELMNALLSTMTSDESAATRKESCWSTLQKVLECITKTSEEAHLSWDHSVFPSARKLFAIVEAWDPAAPNCPRTPDGFSDCANNLLTSYTAQISRFLQGVDTVTEEAEEEEDVALPAQNTLEPADVDPDEGLKERLQEILTDRPDGVGSLLSHAKKWSKYTKDIINYMEKRAALELEYSKKLTGLAKTTLDGLEGYTAYACASTSLTPMLREHMQILNRMAMLRSGPVLCTHVHPLEEMRAQHERVRKQMKDSWTRECRRLAEAGSALQRSRARYQQLCSDWEKTLSCRQKEEQSKYKLKLDKRSKEEGDMRARVDEARRTYETSVRNANMAIADVAELRQNLVSTLLDSMFQGGDVVREALLCYQQDELNSVKPTIDALARLVSSTRDDSASQGVLMQPEAPVEPFTLSPLYSFEPYELAGEVVEYLSQIGEPNRCVDPAAGLMRGPVVSPLPSSLSSSTASPSSKRVQDPQPVGLHTFVKHTIPSKCRHCRHACYFHAVSCVQCGLVCHKRCTELLQIRCKVPTFSTPARRTTSVFGSPLAQLSELDDGIPIIIRRIVESIERRGLAQEGLYRVTGVKSHVEQLCAEFETNPRAVNVEDEDVHVLTAVLKLYFRQLPEPLIPRAVCPRFLQVAKDLQGHKKEEAFVRQAVDRARALVDELPKVNYDTLAFMFIHLARIAQLADLNKMKPSNLGIVFGPTILRSDTATLDTLMDMPHQTVMAELMIDQFSTIFVRYIQAHHVSASARRPRRRIEHVYATVPEVMAEVAALNARESTVSVTSSGPGAALFGGAGAGAAGDVQFGSPEPGPPPLPPMDVTRSPMSMSPATPRSRHNSSERILAPAGALASSTAAALGDATSDDEPPVYTAPQPAGVVSVDSSPGGSLDPTVDESEHGDV